MRRSYDEPQCAVSDRSLPCLQTSGTSLYIGSF
jgi:hypothetical protein